MGVIDVDALAAQISDDSPCGENFEAEPEFGAMESAAKGTPMQELGAPGEKGYKLVPAEPPNWREVKKNALGILEGSKDLRAVTLLTRALLAMEGFAGLHDGLDLLGRLCATRWPDIYPLLDPEDDNDPLMRVNIIESLKNNETLHDLEGAPLVAHRVLGRFGLREIAYASGEVSLPSDFKGDPPTTAMIEGAFMECELDELTATADAVNGAIDLLDKLDGTMAGVMEITSTPDLKPLREKLVEAQVALKQPLERRGVAAAGGDEAENPAEAAGQQRLTGDITSREDVVRAIDKICEFYRLHEPASPVPMILERAKRLVPKDFMEIVEDLAVTVDDVKLFGGPD